MKTTIDIDQNLLRATQKALGPDSIKGTVERSLRTVIQHNRLQSFADALGTIPLDLTTDRLPAATAQANPACISLIRRSGFMRSVLPDLWRSKQDSNR